MTRIKCVKYVAFHIICESAGDTEEEFTFYESNREKLYERLFEERPFLNLTDLGDVAENVEDIIINTDDSIISDSDRAKGSFEDGGCRFMIDGFTNYYFDFKNMEWKKIWI